MAPTGRPGKAAAQQGHVGRRIGDLAGRRCRTLTLSHVSVTSAIVMRDGEAAVVATETDSGLLSA